MTPNSGVLAVLRNQIGVLPRIIQTDSVFGSFNGARELALVEQRAGHEHVGIDLDGRDVFRSRQREPFIEDLFRQSVFATKFVHRGEMKEEWIHLLHSRQPNSEFTGPLKIEHRFRLLRTLLWPEW